MFPAGTGRIIVEIRPASQSHLCLNELGREATSTRTVGEPCAESAAFMTPAACAARSWRR